MPAPVGYQQKRRGGLHVPFTCILHMIESRRIRYEDRQHPRIEAGGGQKKTLRRVTLTVDPDDYAAMKRLARRSKVSASWLVRRSMREFLERTTAERIDFTAEACAARAENAA